MLSRLVLPLAFVIGLVSLVFVIQTLAGSPSQPNSKLTGPALVQQYAIKPIPIIKDKVTNKDNKSVDLTTELAQPTLLTFWSAGCGECEAGLPTLGNFAKTQAKIKVVLINSKDAPEVAQAKLTGLKVSLPTFYDRDGTVFQDYEATMPSSYYISGGEILFFFPGRVSDDILQALLTVQ